MTVSVTVNICLITCMCVSEYLHSLLTTLGEFADITVKSQVSCFAILFKETLICSQVILERDVCHVAQDDSDDSDATGLLLPMCVLSVFTLHRSWCSTS